MWHPCSQSQRWSEARYHEDVGGVCQMFRFSYIGSDLEFDVHQFKVPSVSLIWLGSRPINWLEAAMFA